MNDPTPAHIGTGVHMTGTTFLRSTTKTIVDREADGDTDVSVIHLARFALVPGTILDMKRRYGTWVFRPSWMEVEWRDGELDEVKVTGPRVLKAGLSKHDTGDFKWERRWARRDEAGKRVPFDRDELPGKLAEAIADYETRVATLTGGPR